MPAATCHAPGSPASSTQHAQPALGGAPRAREPDRPAADDGDVRLGLLHRHADVDSFPTPARPGSGSTVGAPVAPSQPDCGLPYARERSARACLTTALMTPRERIALGAPVPRLRRAAARVPRRGAARAASTWCSCATRRSTTTGSSPPRATFRAAADAAGALFVLNDRPDLVAACGADGVHVGQDDGTRRRRARRRRARAHRRPLDARARAGRRGRRRSRRRLPRRRPGARDADEAGRPAAGLEYVDWAAAHVTTPWFAIGGLDAANVDEVAARGARRDRRRARDRRGRRPGGRGARAARRGWRCPLGQRSRKRARRGRPARADAAEDRMARGYARGRAKDDEARAKLKPLAPGRAAARGHDRRDRSPRCSASPTSCCSPPATRSRASGSRPPAC